MMPSDSRAPPSVPIRSARSRFAAPNLSEVWIFRDSQGRLANPGLSGTAMAAVLGRGLASCRSAAARGPPRRIVAIGRDFPDVDGGGQLARMRRHHPGLVDRI